jgi:hypothetical protein
MTGEDLAAAAPGESSGRAARACGPAGPVWGGDLADEALTSAEARVRVEPAGVMRLRAAILAVCVSGLMAGTVGAAPASGQGVNGFVHCDYKGYWDRVQVLPTHRCQLKMKKAAYFTSHWDFPIDWYYCVRYPRTSGDGGHGDGGHPHRHSAARLPAYRQCYPPETTPDYYVAQPGTRYRSWLHTHRRGKHIVTWWVRYQDGWRLADRWWFSNALHFHV